MSRVICDQLRCRYNEGEYCEYSGDLIWWDGKCECQDDAIQQNAQSVDTAQ